MLPVNEADDAYEEFEGLMRHLASGVTPNRVEATRWSHCRSLLLDDDYRDRLPGFVIQCGSVFKYRDFISLYDPSVAQRIAFVEDAMADARSLFLDRARTRFAVPEGETRASPRDDGTPSWTF